MAWALLAEGASALGQADRSSRLDVIAASKAESRGDADSARRWRFRAGSTAFAAGRFARADALFSRIADDREAGPLRARSGMLRALSRGRGLEAEEPGITRADYLDALESQIRDFPDDPATGEARWLLGRSHLDGDRRQEAASVWETIPKAHPRWIDARLALAALRLAGLHERRLVDDPAAIRSLGDRDYRLADLDRQDAHDDPERIDLALALARIDLTPGAGRATRALESLDRLRLLPLDSRQRGHVTALGIVALVAIGKPLEAERTVRDFKAPPEAQVEALRFLDLWATADQADRNSRRIGGIEKAVADRLAAIPGLPPEIGAEARLRQARGRMLSGDLRGAREILKDWPDPSARVPALMDDLAGLQAEVGDFPGAIASYREEARRATPGSPRWLAAQLGQAQALAASERWEAARLLLEGTSLLHPDLGGPRMKAQFEALRKKVDRR